jgi:hypothetical protein
MPYLQYRHRNNRARKQHEPILSIHGNDIESNIMLPALASAESAELGIEYRHQGTGTVAPDQTLRKIQATND